MVEDTTGKAASEFKANARPLGEKIRTGSAAERAKALAGNMKTRIEQAVKGSRNQRDVLKEVAKSKQPNQELTPRETTALQRYLALMNSPLRPTMKLDDDVISAMKKRYGRVLNLTDLLKLTTG